MDINDKDFVERRSAPRRSKEIDVQLEQLIVDMISTLNNHINEEEKGLKLMSDTLINFIGDLDKHTHLHHHGWVDVKMSKEVETETWFKTMKHNIIEKVVLFLLGLFAMWLVGAGYTSIKTDILSNKVAVEKHAEIDKQIVTQLQKEQQK
jgi:hypothetical protein